MIMGDQTLMGHWGSGFDSESPETYPCNKGYLDKICIR